MDRRAFIKSLGLAATLPHGISYAFADAPARPTGYGRLLFLIELKGGNDGLNTVVPFADEQYYALRPRLAIARDQVLQLDSRSGLHPALQPLMGLWEGGELAVVQGVGYPDPNLSHFRSIEIWDTASNSNEYLADGWLTRAFAAQRPPRNFAADGMVMGGSDLGPLSGRGTRVIALANAEQFLRQARLAAPSGQAINSALNHILTVEQDIVQAAANMRADFPLRTQFPPGQFGNLLKGAAQLVAGNAGVAVVKVALPGFDTHSNQPATQQRLLKEFADGVVALKGALGEAGRWDSTLVMTYAEFGRRPRENLSGGTDHGTANAHFVAGGAVRGGLYGVAPNLQELDGNGNLPFAVDFRVLYATALEKWWNVPSRVALGGRFDTLDLLKT